jgi:hypothetical protein
MNNRTNKTPHRRAPDHVTEPAVQSTATRPGERLTRIGALDSTERPSQPALLAGHACILVSGAGRDMTRDRAV